MNKETPIYNYHEKQAIESTDAAIKNIDVLQKQIKTIKEAIEKEINALYFSLCNSCEHRKDTKCVICNLSDCHCAYCPIVKKTQTSLYYKLK